MVYKNTYTELKSPVIRTFSCIICLYCISEKGYDVLLKGDILSATTVFPTRGSEPLCTAAHRVGFRERNQKGETGGS